MTWYLRRLERDQDEETPAQPVPVPTRIDQFAAGAREYTITENARFYRQRLANSRIEGMVTALGGLDAIAPSDPEDQEILGAQMPQGTAMETPFGNVTGDVWRDRWRALPVDQQIEYLARRASHAVRSDPARFGRIPVSREQFDEQLRQAMLDELAEAQEVLDAGSNPVVQFLGNMASAATDEIALPLLAAGPLTIGPRQAGRFILQEALIGAAAEVAALPRAQQQAALLELQDPGVWERIAMGATFGAAFGGAFVAGARGIDYLRTRNQAEGELRPRDIPGPEYQARIDADEARLRAGDDSPFAAPATQAGAVDTSQPMVLSIGGPTGNQAAMVRLPDGSIAANLRVGDTLEDGARITAIGNDRITFERDGEVFSVEVGQSLAAPSSNVEGQPPVTFSRVASAGPGFTVLVGPDGQAVRREGTRAWRNNNPGNIEFGPFAQSRGAIGTDGRFAVFPTYEDGRRAKEALLWESNAYRGMTINQAIHRYAPPFENDTAAYVSAVARAVGVGADTPMSALTPAQRQTMLDAMERVEGFRPGRENGVQVDAPPRAEFGALADDPGRPPAPFDFGAPGPAGTSRAMTRFDEVVTPAGTRVPVEYRVVDLDSLTPARDEFQPRDRSRSGSDEQIAEIAARLDAVRLLPSTEADRGAPIVGQDMMVESGNGRVMALRRASEQHPDRYQAYVEALGQAGFEIPEGVRRPALVAVRRNDFTPEQRRAFVTEANDSGTMRMAASEQAGRDADFLTSTVFDAYQPGQPVANQGEFLRRMLAAMPQSERAAMYDATGRLSADGLRRVRQALFAKAFNAPDLLRMLAESPDPRMRAMLDMLEELAPDWAAFRADIEAGYVRAEFDITEPMIDIVRIIARARTEGRDGQSVIAAIRDHLAQQDMFATRDDALSEALLATFYKGDRARRPSDAGEILRRYMVDAQEIGRGDVVDLLGGVAPAEVLTRALENHEGRAPYSTPVRPRAEDVDIPDTREIDPAPMLDGAESPVLIRAAAATEAEIRAVLQSSDNIDDLMAASRARLAARDAEVTRLAADDAPVRFQSEDGQQRALVSQSPDQPGRWRVTYIDDAGPVRHSDFDTKADALRRALEENFTAAPAARKPAAPAREVETEPDLSFIGKMPKTRETVAKLVDMANVAVPRGYRFKIEGNDIWLSAPDGDLRATRNLDLNISPQGIFFDLQRAIDLATENAAGSDAMVRAVTLPDDVDPAAVRAVRDAMFDDPAMANLTPQQEIVEAVRRVRAGAEGVIDANATPARTAASEATPAGEQTLIPGVDPVTQRQRLEADMARPIAGRDAGPGSGRDDLFGNPEDRRDLLDAPQRGADGQVDAPAPPPAGRGEMAAAADAASEFAPLRDMTIRLDENGPEVRVSDILDDLDANAEFAAVVQVCATRRG